MNESSHFEQLGTECQVFTRYLIDAAPPSEVVAAYRRAHEVSPVAPRDSLRALDRALLRVARMGPRSARAADGYAAAFAKGSLLRRKLVLLVAILESRQHTAVLFDTAEPGSRAAWVFTVGLRMAGCVLAVCFAALVIVPLYSWYRVRGPHAPNESGVSSRTTP
jgi:hypothetical protein